MNNPVLVPSYKFENSTSFQIIKIDNEQITNYANKWFLDKELTKPDKSTSFSKNQLVEIPTSKLLTTLLWLVFEETGEVIKNRLQLYEEGLAILLKKWDNTRSIKQDQVYNKLSLQRKENLLSHIALKTFEHGDYFLNEKELEQYIADYICNLPDAQTNLELLQLDSKAVLKSIEAQHGILVELTEGIYSFSILAFHEYLTAKEIVYTPNPQALEKALQSLVSHVTETRWREVFLLTVGMVCNADYLLNLIRHQTNALIASNQELQHFLAWSNQISNSAKALYKPLALRAFYIEFVLDIEASNAAFRGNEKNVDFNFSCSLDNNLAYDFEYSIANVHNYTHELQNWRFSEQQKKVLKQYYDANKLLLDCLITARYVTRNVREEIENTLLVPSEM